MKFLNYILCVMSGSHTGMFVPWAQLRETPRLYTNVCKHCGYPMYMDGTGCAVPAPKPIKPNIKQDNIP